MIERYYHDHIYLSLVQHILKYGDEKEDRTGTGTLSTFGQQMQFSLRNGIIPLLTTKKMHTKSIIHELLWFLSGDTNVRLLQEKGVRIWNEWADENGDLGPVYGRQWRRWPQYRERQSFRNPDGIYELAGHVDQIERAIELLRVDPNSRRIVVSAWNAAELDQMALVPCHAFFQFYVANGELSCMLTQRSCDMGLGVPFNIAQYSILTHMVAHVTGLEPGVFVWNGGDAHIYKNHIEPLKEQFLRSPYPSPTVWLNPAVKEIDDFTYEDIKIENYQSHPTLKMEVSV